MAQGDRTPQLEETTMSETAARHFNGIATDITGFIPERGQDAHVPDSEQCPTDFIPLRVHQSIERGVGNLIPAITCAWNAIGAMLRLSLLTA